MALVSSGSNNHSITFRQGVRYGSYYEIAWTVDFKYPGDRSRYPRTFSKHTDELGASRFCEKWNLTPPDALKAYHEARLAKKAARAAKQPTEQEPVTV